MVQSSQPEITYRFRTCSERIRTIMVGSQQVNIHELMPAGGAYLEFGSLLSYCSWLVRHGALVIMASEEAMMLTDLTPFGFPHGREFFLFKHFFKNTSLSDYIAPTYIERLAQPAEVVALENCLQAMADSIGDCVVLPLFSPPLRRAVGWPSADGFLVGRPALMTSVIDSSGMALEEIPHGAARDLLSDLEMLGLVSELGGAAEQSPEAGDSAAAQPHGPDYCAGLGRCLAALHNARILCDTHLGNFLRDGRDGVVKLVDLDPPLTVLLRPAGARECAANLVPLRAFLSGRQWEWFGEGYVGGRGEAGEVVVRVFGGEPVEEHEELLHSGRYFEAIAPLSEVVRNADSARADRAAKAAQANLGFCLSQIGEYDAAARAYERALLFADSDIDQLVIHFNAAKALNRGGHFLRAAEKFEAVLALSEHTPETPPTMLLEALSALVVTYDGAGKADECAARCTSLADALGRFREAGVAVNRSAADLIALAHATCAVRSNPTSAAALLERARVRRELSSPEAALEDLARAVELEPTNVGALVESADIYAEMEMPGSAEASLNRAIERAPGDENLIRRRAALYKAAGQHGKLADDLSRLLKLHPDESRWLFARAEAHVAAGEVELALADVSRAIEIDAGNPSLFIIRGQWLAASGRLREGLADFDHAAEILLRGLKELEGGGEPNIPAPPWDKEAAPDGLDEESIKAMAGGCFQLRGQACMGGELYEQAVSDFSRAIDCVPHRSAYRLLRSEAFEKVGRLDEAIADVNFLIEKGSYSWKHLQQRGRLRRLKGDLEGSLDDLFKAKESWLKTPWSGDMPAVDRKLMHEAEPGWALSEFVE